MAMWDSGVVRIIKIINSLLYSGYRLCILAAYPIDVHNSEDSGFSLIALLDDH
jgi:hypothetical protein